MKILKMILSALFDGFLVISGAVGVFFGTRPDPELAQSDLDEYHRRKGGHRLDETTRQRPPPGSLSFEAFLEGCSGCESIYNNPSSYPLY